ncbi:MAG: ribosome maturation factor RimM [Gammaproteobacteria bacterium]|nr:ribosome maturation factor RimM [Gammaproteobacteria bacterium]MBU6510130.1 ribosome maturation factor RimM [Gammaproteobacteria bacterium]MDE1983942.1 ribosome maturation factor RimM [Gammaproteobacteria bacterium]MDE2108143.1 ribosome maturation factor RimM [Gammaproteobacteria bacterium]
MAEAESRRVVLGKITAPFGVKGWVKLQSWTEPPERIIEYRSWLLETNGTWRQWQVAEGRPHGKSMIARIEGVSDRDQAAALTGAAIAVRREQLPALKPGEYYWADLLGLEVRLEAGRSLGRVHALMATGANDVLVVRGERERLIPFIRGQVVKQVDSDAGIIFVDWDPDF